MKQIWSVFLLLFIFFNTYAQKKESNFIISGRVTDAETAAAIPFATVSLTETFNKKLLKYAITDSLGAFKIELDKKNNLMLSIAVFNYEKYSKNLILKSDKKIYDLGTIKLKSVDKELGEVEVNAVKSLVRTEADKIVYNAQSDPDAASNSTLEILRKVPMLSVDGDDNIRLNGSTSFKVLINGKESVMTKDNASTFLKGLPASAVQEIEVIKSPGAKYDAEGVGGIINIITKQKSLEGYTLNFNTGVSTLKDYYSYLYGAISFGKFVISARISGGYGGNTPSYYDYERNNFNDNSLHFLKSTNENTYKSKRLNTSVNMSYEIDSLNLISSTFSFWGNRILSKGLNETKIYDINDQLQQAYTISPDIHGSYQSLTAGIDYQLTSPKDKNRFLTLSGRYSNKPRTSDTEQSIDSIYKYFNSRSKIDLSNKTDEYTFQADYEYPISKYLNINLGTKYIARRNSSLSEKQNFNYQTLIYEDIVDRSVDFAHNQDIIAAYLSTNGKFNKFGYKLGLRMENSFTKVIFTNNENMNFKNSHLELVPSLSLSYSVNPKYSIQLNYNKRIQRPSIRYLNPTVDDRNPKNISYGNPELDTEHFHSLNLSLNSFTTIGSFVLNGYYSYSNNAIGEILFMKDIDVLHSTYENIVKKHTVGMNLSANLFLYKKLSVNLNASLYYKMLEHNQNASLNNTTISSYNFVNISYILPLSFKLSGYGGFYRFGGELQQEGSRYYYYSLGLSKGFLKDKLRISLSASNFLSKYITTETSSKDDFFYAVSKSKDLEREFSISLSYRIGNMKSNVKKTRHSINNNDLKSEESGAGGK